MGSLARGRPTMTSLHASPIEDERGSSNLSRRSARCGPATAICGDAAAACCRLLVTTDRSCALNEGATWSNRASAPTFLLPPPTATTWTDLPNLGQGRVAEPDQIHSGCADITTSHHRDRHGVVYLAVDLVTPARCGYSNSGGRGLRPSWRLAALIAAIGERKPPRDCTPHSDRGLAICCLRTTATRPRATWTSGARWGRRGKPLTNNSKAESFMKTPKVEEVYLMPTNLSMTWRRHCRASHRQGLQQQSLHSGNVGIEPRRFRTGSCPARCQTPAPDLPTYLGCAPLRGRILTKANAASSASGVASITTSRDPCVR